MRDDPTRFVGSIPDFLRQGAGPRHFRRSRGYDGRRSPRYSHCCVLEIAGGTGIVTQRLRAPGSPPESQIITTDLNGGMLEISRTKFAADGMGVSFQVADATALPVRRQRIRRRSLSVWHDVFPRQRKGLRGGAPRTENGRALHIQRLGRPAHNPFGRIIAEVLRDAFASDAPPFMSVPFSYASIDTIKASLQS